MSDGASDGGSHGDGEFRGDGGSRGGSGSREGSTSSANGEAASPGRREFLKVTTAAGVTLLGGCLSDSDSQSLGVNAAAFAQFNHFVVLMSENRSFDSLLGFCYQPGEPPRNQTFNGLTENAYPNPVPAYINDGNAVVTTRISPGSEADMQNPNPDPGEEYQHVNTALFNVVDPISNQFKDAGDMLPPYNAPPGPMPATMNGFVWDYCNNFVNLNARNPTFEEYRVIMDSFSPQQLPVINTLAKEFAVYDAWFSAVPTQTIPNRSFFHASTSSGFVVNEDYSKWPEQNNAPTIFNRLSDAGLTWRVYYDETQVLPMTALIHGSSLVEYWDKNFYTMDEFYQDVANGTLPNYAFIEPRMMYNNNDYHPPAPLAKDVPIGGWSDVRWGEVLVHDVYTAIKQSGNRPGSNALNTLLLITFDEHGNCFDHVPPPPAISPQNPQPQGEKGFFFDRLGVRVPAIVVSAYTQANTIVNRTVNHAALIRTLREKYDLDALTDRDRNAPDLSDAINLTQPRDPSTWPSPIPRPAPPPPSLDERPLNGVEQILVGLAVAKFSPQPVPMPTRLGDALSLLRSLVGDTFKHA